ncbi:hypothetical protein SAMD00023353_1301350 [Rosellinia necatrix]|uniref:Uncharacterized protein n=1 Tax=Rosellinia necatrix TaxID=77044 RepID=A0A1W2TCB4_ROSNE|nr:hypothetical protein SAMD00023353_1301350 [Rosellinia necatrix]
MAAPEASQRVADIQRRATEKPEVAFKAFDTYPWQADQLFNRTLTGALYAVEPNGPRLVEIALQMRIERFAERIKIRIDKEAYAQWLSETGNLQPRLFSDQNLAQEVEGKVPPEQRRLAILHAELGHTPYQPVPELEDPSIPSWQRRAPKAELFVPKNAGPSSSDEGALPYPKKFEEIVKFLETGQMIPGVRQIPDTVVDDPSISTHGTMQAPLKPWERRNSGGAATNAGQDLGTSSNDTIVT